VDDSVIMAGDLRRRGISGDEVARLVNRGELVRLRRGAYLDPGAAVDDGIDPWDLRPPHLRLVAGTMPQLHPRAVLSHGSAAALHGLPLFAGMVETVHVTRDRRGGGVIRRTLRVHGSALRESDRCLVDDRPVTSLARTVVDLARTLPYQQAVAVADRGLALGLDPHALGESLEQAASWRSAPQARRVIAFADGRSESVGESFSRVTLHASEVPSPVLQYKILDHRGLLVARCDFAWIERRTVGEFDGRVKYGRFRQPGESSADAVHREKLREDAIRDQGWQVVRWVWDDLATPRVIVDRLQRAFDRAHR
jgi:hypothetical protein